MDYEKDWQGFWLPIVTNDKGEVDMVQIKKELSDYHTFMGTASKVYMHVTDGKISKINTTAEAIIGEFDNIYGEISDKARDWDDLYDEISKCYKEDGDETPTLKLHDEEGDTDLCTIGELAATAMGFL